MIRQFFPIPTRRRRTYRCNVIALMRRADHNQVRALCLRAAGIYATGMQVSQQSPMGNRHGTLVGSRARRGAIPSPAFLIGCATSSAPPGASSSLSGARSGSGAASSAAWPLSARRMASSRGRSWSHAVLASCSSRVSSFRRSCSASRSACSSRDKRQGRVCAGTDAQGALMLACTRQRTNYFQAKTAEVVSSPARHKGPQAWCVDM